MPPMAKAMVSKVSPKAKATPRKPIPRCPAPGSPAGNEAANSALPQPPKTNQNVPKNSAAARLPIDIVSSQFVGFDENNVVALSYTYDEAAGVQSRARCWRKSSAGQCATYFTVACARWWLLARFLLLR